MRRADVNPIDVIEAAYDLERDEKTWLREIATLVRPLLDGGQGLLAYEFDVKQPPSTWYEHAATIDFDADHLPLIQEMQARAPDVTSLVHLGFDGLLVLSELVRKAGTTVEAAVGPYFEVARVSDFVALQTVEPGSRGIVFCAGQTSRRTFDRRTRQLWARVNVHIAAARRLRAGLTSTDAVLDPDGKVHHAEGEGATKPAREALRAAVLRVEKSRGKQRSRDPEAATEAWTALVAGRWSLVDRFERGGRRYVVARRNELALPDPRALTARERTVAHLAALGKSNKLIGYELGLSESTVGSHLSQAMRKLGVGSRVELIGMIIGLTGAE